MGLESYLKESGFITTKLDAIIGWARKNSVWPMPMGISCCAIEMMAVGDPKYDIARFGSAMNINDNVWFEMRLVATTGQVSAPQKVKVTVT